MMKLYHEISTEALESVLREGLRCTSRGKKGDDSAIYKTDQLLDSHCPKNLKAQDISRDNNLYAYVCVDSSIIDITDGSRVPLTEFVASSSGTVLELAVTQPQCFVSDLDAYDTLKASLEEGASGDTLAHLARSYWSKLMPLSEFTPSSIQRPEIMIPFDVPPAQITVLNS